MRSLATNAELLGVVLGNVAVLPYITMVISCVFFGFSVLLALKWKQQNSISQAIFLLTRAKIMINENCSIPSP